MLGADPDVKVQTVTVTSKEQFLFLKLKSRTKVSLFHLLVEKQPWLVNVFFLGREITNSMQW